MAFALAVAALVALALMSDMLHRPLAEAWERHRARRRYAPELSIDPGRERRAERTARELLRSCVGEQEWAMYRELGFIRVWGRGADGGADYAYLIYPHRPIISYSVQTGRVLSEHCVTFPDRSGPHGSERLPDSDDVLAKWMALTGDEHRLIANANMHLPGRQTNLTEVTRDIWRLTRWEQERSRARATQPSLPDASAAKAS